MELRGGALTYTASPKEGDGCNTKAHEFLIQFNDTHVDPRAVRKYSGV
jgi:hypothetical protein